MQNILYLDGMKKYLLLALPLGLLLSCGNNETKEAKTAAKTESKLKPLSWMLGDWAMEYPDGLLTETWTMGNDSVWEGRSSFISKEGRNMMTENIQLIARGSKVVYLPTVSNQNDGKPVSFEATLVSDSLAVFENPAHDFPQRIIYRHLADSILEARIEGVDSGKRMADVFTYKRHTVLK